MNEGGFELREVILFPWVTIQIEQFASLLLKHQLPRTFADCPFAVSTPVERSVFSARQQLLTIAHPGTKMKDRFRLIGSGLDRYRPRNKLLAAGHLNARVPN